MMYHARKAFVLGFILSSEAILKVAKIMVTSNRAEYLMTYRMSQDHLELLFRCIRGKSGYNNNPDVLQFRSSLRHLLMKNSIRCSKNANCLEMESECSSIYHFKWTSRWATPLQEDVNAELQEAEMTELCQTIEGLHLSELQEAVVGYIAGYIVRKMRRNMSCVICADALTDSANRSADHARSQLILKKQKGGLLTPAAPVWKLVEKCERTFRVIVSWREGGQISSRKNVGLLLYTIVMRQSSIDFPQLSRHDLQMLSDSEDLHSSQLKKIICKEYAAIRFFTYGHNFNANSLPSHKIGYRQKLSKAILFANL